MKINIKLPKIVFIKKGMLNFGLNYVVKNLTIMSKTLRQSINLSVFDSWVFYNALLNQNSRFSF